MRVTGYNYIYTKYSNLLLMDSTSLTCVTMFNSVHKKGTWDKISRYSGVLRCTDLKFR